jgi:hypothetical protein
MNTKALDEVLAKLSQAINSDEIDSSPAPKQRGNRFDALIEKYTADSPHALRPWNYQDYLIRLKSFKYPSHWFAKDHRIGE